MKKKLCATFLTLLALMVFATSVFAAEARWRNVTKITPIILASTNTYSSVINGSEGTTKIDCTLTLDFIAHGFCAGIAEMDMNLVGRLADFLYHRWRVFRRSGRSSGVCHLHSTGFFVHSAPFSERVCAAR